MTEQASGGLLQLQISCREVSRDGVGLKLHFHSSQQSRWGKGLELHEGHKMKKCNSLKQILVLKGLILGGGLDFI